MMSAGNVPACNKYDLPSAVSKILSVFTRIIVYRNLPDLKLAELWSELSQKSRKRWPSRSGRGPTSQIPSHIRQKMLLESCRIGRESRATVLWKDRETRFKVSLTVLFANPYFAADQIISRAKRVKQPSLGSYNPEKADARIYKPTVRRRWTTTKRQDTSRLLELIFMSIKQKEMYTRIN